MSAPPSACATRSSPTLAGSGRPAAGPSCTCGPADSTPSTGKSPRRGSARPPSRRAITGWSASSPSTDSPGSSRPQDLTISPSGAGAAVGDGDGRAPPIGRARAAPPAAAAANTPRTATGRVEPVSATKLDKLPSDRLIVTHRQLAHVVVGCSLLATRVCQVADLY